MAEVNKGADSHVAEDNREAEADERRQDPIMVRVRVRFRVRVRVRVRVRDRLKVRLRVEAIQGLNIEPRPRSAPKCNLVEAWPWLQA